MLREMAPRRSRRLKGALTTMKYLQPRSSLALVASLGFAFVACGGDDGANGKNGTNGADGEPGNNALAVSTVEPPGDRCAEGGQTIQTGVDRNANGELDDDEVTDTAYVCN